MAVDKKSSKRGLATAMSYGPVRYGQALIVGFIISVMIFLAVAAPSAEGSGLDQLPLLISASIGGAALALIAAAAANYAIGRRILEERERTRTILEAGGLPLQLRPDAPAFDLGRRAGFDAASTSVAQGEPRKTFSAAARQGASELDTEPSCASDHL